jgi:diketogulonate reductase-like aldo/keto reductase
MRTCALPDGTPVPVLGLGTWRLGESGAQRAREVAALRQALEMGYRLFDTAEMYADGGAETVLGTAIGEALRAGGVRREELFIVTKVYPHNASRTGTVAACERSLARLALDHVDLYLLHWHGQHPLADTCAAMRSLVERGMVRYWGVSNFDVDDMQELDELQRKLEARAGGAAAFEDAPGLRCAADQVYYSLRARGVERELLAWLRRNGMPLMAYSPIDEGQLASDGFLAGLGRRLGASAAQIALAWVLRQPGVIAIPKAAREDHLRENLAALDLALPPEILAQLDRRFPAPRGKPPLDMR